jgi:hypothetical protein
MSMRKATPTASAYYGAPITYPQHTAVPYPQYAYPQYTAAHYAGQSHLPNAIPQHVQHYNPAHYHVPPPTGAYFGPTHTAGIADFYKGTSNALGAIIDYLGSTIASKRDPLVNGALLYAGHETFHTKNAGTGEHLLGVAMQLSAIASALRRATVDSAEAVGDVSKIATGTG